MSEQEARQILGVTEETPWEEIVRELFDYIVPTEIIGKLLNQKFMFAVDSRPIGYQMDKSLHIVRGLLDDSSLIGCLEGADNVNHEQLFEVGSGSAQIPLD
ncbi:hypothetical protein PIB30_020970 [Stylosanthes scabra]|uniref:Uncharacterized protein n=1 Tax=Stylosanthes scabra TaxID=79078 RepID=A0ABU6S8H8_9FABA|nr:hypothetical protein [Stylosanthes scabra]